MTGEPPKGTAEGAARAVSAMAVLLGTRDRLPQPGGQGDITQILCLCLCHLVRSVGDFDMTAPAYYDNLRMVQYDAIGSCIHNTAVKRTHMLFTFMCNNSHWLEKTRPARCVLEDMLEEADNC